MRFSEAAFSSGVETHKIDGVTVRLYCPAKTVADCFKYRNKIGLDVAIEALRECLAASANLMISGKLMISIVCSIFLMRRLGGRGPGIP